MTATESSRAAEQAPRQTRVLVVDDSAVVREVLATLLRRATGFEIVTAASAEIALDRMQRARPDVIVLDLELPAMSGIELLARIMAEDPVPVIVCSGLAQPGAAVAMRALELGAVDVVAKPELGLRGFLESSGCSMADLVRAAAGARIQRRRVVHPVPTPTRAREPQNRYPCAVIGASTGGTEALRDVLSRLPADAPGLVIVQHMPAGFTAAFAARLDGLSAMHVREAVDGDRVQPGLALVAPGGRHVTLERAGDALRVRVIDGLLVSGHRPSVDVLFESAARAAAPDVIGVLLTGMGADGARGLHALRQGGALTIAQNESTCVVYGMPREAVLLGAVAESLPPDRIARSLLRAPPKPRPPVATSPGDGEP